MGCMAFLQSPRVSHSVQVPNSSAPPPLSKSANLNRAAHGGGGAAGLFEYTKLPLEEPNEFLPDTSRPLAAPRWFFEKYSPQQFSALLGSCDLSEQQRVYLLDGQNWQEMTNGIVVTPSAELVLGMNRSARERIYSI